MDHEPRDTSTPEVNVGVPSELLPAPMMPGRNGGLLRRGNPGNKGNRSAIAREILEASTPQAAAILKRMSLQGKVGRGKDARTLSDPDRIKAVTAHLDRGGAPAVSAISAVGSPFTVLVGAAAKAAEPDSDSPHLLHRGNEAEPTR